MNQKFNFQDALEQIKSGASIDGIKFAFHYK